MPATGTGCLRNALGAGCALLLAASGWAAVQVTAQADLARTGQPTQSHQAPVRVAQAAKPEAAPAWATLTPAQKQALGPLSGTWKTLSEAHKRKWIALSENFTAKPPAEQARLHSRMAEWAALSPQQRTQARLNFAETQKLPAVDRKAKWEAYQALPPEEKRKLAAGAAAAKPATPSTAAALQPVPRQKLATVPGPKKPDDRSPRIAGVPSQVDHHTLLPQPGALPVQP